MRGASCLHLRLGHRSKTRDSTYPKTLVQILKILEKVRTCGGVLAARGLNPRDGESQRVSGSVVSSSLPLLGLQPSRLLCPWDSPGQNTGVGSHSCLQGIFPTQGSNPGLPYCRQILCHPRLGGRWCLVVNSLPESLL